MEGSCQQAMVAEGVQSLGSLFTVSELSKIGLWTILRARELTT